MTSGYEVIEHTADVGLRAWGASLEQCFEQATWALADIIGIHRPGAGEPVTLEVQAADLEGLLVDWLSEVLYLHDTRDATLAGVEIESVDARNARGTVSLSPRRADVEGTQVKAVTYHRLSVAREDGLFVAHVYVDV
jgi:SHS2 domain-containing protein